MLYKYSIYLLHVFVHLTKPVKFEMKLTHEKGKAHLVLRIVGGYEVEISKYPYTAQYGPSCGAAIIHEKWALTAQHCDPFKYLLVGSKKRGSGKNISIINTHDHLGWVKNEKEHNLDYDFRLLELNESLDFNDPNVQPIKLAHPDDMVVGKLITVTGWGKTRDGGKKSPVLRAVQLPIVSHESCQQIPLPFLEVTSRMFCAGYKRENKDACEGDSGGPAAANGRLIGTVSFGFGCATDDYYGVYGNVASVRNWVMSITGLNFE